jgi:uncharacterized protein YjbI with pentapeptide repeats
MMDDFQLLSMVDRSIVLRNGAFVIAAFIGLVGIWLAWRRTKALGQQADTDQSRLASQKQHDLESRVTDNLGISLDLISKEGTDARVGAIYLLEKVSKSSSSDYWLAIEILCNYLRTNFPTDTSPHIASGRPQSERDAVLNVLSRRKLDFEPNNSHLDLRECNFSNAQFDKEAPFEFAVLDRSDLSFAKGLGIHFESTNLLEANFRACQLPIAMFDQTVAQYAIFEDAYLPEASFRGADLSGANFRNSDLSNADFTDAVVLGCEFSGAELSGTIGLPHDLFES